MERKWPSRHSQNHHPTGKGSRRSHNATQQRRSTRRTLGKLILVVSSVCVSISLLLAERQHPTGPIITANHEVVASEVRRNESNRRMEPQNKTQQLMDGDLRKGPHGEPRTIAVQNATVMSPSQWSPIQPSVDLTSGGIIIFLHIPKTGGITIRRFFEDWQASTGAVKCLVITRLREWRRRQNRLRKYFQARSSNGKLIYIELHGGGDDFNYWDHQRQVIAEWQSLAKASNVPVWTFTLVRDPVQHALSHFAFYHTSPNSSMSYHHDSKTIERRPLGRGRAHVKRYTQVSNVTESSLRDHLVPNAQCLFLTHGEAAYESQRWLASSIDGLTMNRFIHGSGIGNRNTAPNVEGCRKVWDSLETNCDWVGTTEQLSNETLPFLEKLRDRYSTMTGLPTRGGRRRRRICENENRHKVLQWNNLSAATQTLVGENTRWDAEFYRRVIHSN